MYASAVLQGHEICPFCKEFFAEGERTECPTCGVKLIPQEHHEASVDAGDGDDEEEGDPELPWLHWGNGRGPVLLASLLGLAFFFLPWVNVFTPDRAVYTGLEMGRRTGMVWAAAVGWFTLLPVVLSRRTLPRLRGARLAAALMALIPGFVALLLLVNPPGAIEVRGLVLKVRFEWGPGTFLTLALSLATAPFALLRLGKPGKTDA